VRCPAICGNWTAYAGNPRQKPSQVSRRMKKYENKKLYKGRNEVKTRDAMPPGKDFAATLKIDT